MYTLYAFILYFTLSGLDPSEVELTRKIIDDGRSYLGYKYRTRVETDRVFDCSGFVSHILDINGIEISRSSASMSKEVEVVPLENTQPGDLLFFKGRDINSSRIGHVAMVAERQGNKILMIHATRRGIVLDEYKAGYYSKRFVLAGRLPKHARACLNEEQLRANESAMGSINSLMNSK